MAEPPMQHHPYRPTMVGLCLQCRLPMASHPIEVHLVEPQEPGPCAVNHDQLVTVLGERGSGLSWSLCRQCGVQVEQRYESIGAQGSPNGKGRGSLTPRVKQRLLALPGWVAYLGGD